MEKRMFMEAGMFFFIGKIFDFREGLYGYKENIIQMM